MSGNEKKSVGIGGSSHGTIAPRPPAKKELAGKLDKDNNLMSLSPKKEKLQTRLKKSLKPPAVKTFHGENLESRRGPPIGAIYDFDEEPDTTPQYDVMTLTLEELMQQPDFLRIGILFLVQKNVIIIFHRPNESFI